MATLALAALLLAGQTDPIGRWQFDRVHVRGKTARALKGKVHATVVGPVRFGSEKPRALVLGVDKGQNHVSISEDLSKAPLPKESITVEAWVRVDRPQKWGGIVGALQDNGNYEKGWLLGFQGSNFFFALASAGGKGKLTYLKAPGGYDPGSWYHVVGTYDGREQRLYVDGKLSTSGRAQSGAIAYPPKGFYVIGAYRDDNEYYPMTGQIAEVSVWARALGTADVKAAFESRKKLFPGVEPAAAAVVDWPTWLRDNARSGTAVEAPKLPLTLKWTYRARHAPEPAWPPPAKQDFWHKKTNLKSRVAYDRAFHVVTVGDRVFFGSSADDRVVCLDATTGRERWSFFTEGPVRLAPTVAGDRVLAGSDDGHVYCLDAATGKLRWKHRSAPVDRRIAGNGRIIGARPVRTGVLIDGDVAHFCAGIFPAQGVAHVAVNVRTGKRLGEAPVKVSPQGYMRKVGDGLRVTTGRDPAGAFVAKLKRRGKTKTPAALKIPKDYPFAFIAAGELRFGGGDGKIAAFSAADGREVWSAEVEGKAYSLAVARGRLFASTDAGRIHCFSAERERRP